MEGLVYIFSNWHSNAALNSFMKLLTFLGDGALFWFAFALVLLLFKKTRKSALVMLICLAVGYVLNDFILKFIFARPRPFSVHPEFLEFLKTMGISTPKGYSFPSGHAFSSFCCAVSLTFQNKKLGFIAIPMAILISFSRVFFCVHYPTDVLFGAIFGTLVAIGVNLLILKIFKMKDAHLREQIR